MDHGNPSVDGATVWFCSDEHLTFGPPRGTSFADWRAARDVAVGRRIHVWPAHIDPTIALHETIHVVADRDAPDDETAVVEVWPVDLRGW